MSEGEKGATGRLVESREARGDEAKFVVQIFLVSMAVLFAYPIIIGWRSGWSIGGPEEWGWFGDYLGGVVGPIIGVATIVLIVRTLKVTRAEGEKARALLIDQLQQYKEDFDGRERARRLELAEDRVRWLIGYWDQLIDSVRYHGPVAIDPLSGLMTGCGRTAREILNDPYVRVGAHKLLEDEETKDSATFVWNATFNVCVNALEDIAVALDEFQAAGGTAQMTIAYKKKLAPAVRIFAAVKIIPQRTADQLNVALFMGPLPVAG